MGEKQIFISYRRDDSGDVAGRIHEHLSKAFGESAIFFDVIKSIPLGRDFSDFITEAISQVKVMLVIIGKQWADIKNSAGNRRLELRDDWVRQEIEAGLERGKYFPVIPIFVQSSNISEDQLPDSLKLLTKRNGIQVRREPDFLNDIGSLVEAIAQLGVPKVSKPNSEFVSRTQNRKAITKGDHSGAFAGDIHNSSIIIGGGKESHREKGE